MNHKWILSWGLLPALMTASSLFAQEMVPTVEGGNQAKINVELNNMNVVAIRGTNAGRVFDLVKATQSSNSSAIVNVWDCEHDVQGSIMAIPINTLKTAYINKAAVTVEAQLTVVMGKPSVYCLTDAHLNSAGLDKLLENFK